MHSPIRNNAIVINTKEYFYITVIIIIIIIITLIITNVVVNVVLVVVRFVVIFSPTISRSDKKSVLQVVEAHRVMKRRGSHIF
jgi:hypothetical protein